jgi:hypothetical protein
MSDMIGFALIKEMSKDDMIEEMLSHQRTAWKAMNRHDLIHMLIQGRLIRYKERLTSESDLGECSHGGFFGGSDSD